MAKNNWLSPARIQAQEAIWIELDQAPTMIDLHKAYTRLGELMPGVIEWRVLNTINLPIAEQLAMVNAKIAELVGVEVYELEISVS